MAGHLQIQPALHLGGQIKDFHSHSAKSSANPQVAVDQPTSHGTPTWRRRPQYHISLTDINICQSLFRDCRAPGRAPWLWRRQRPASLRLSHRGCSAKARRNPELSESSMISRYTRPEMASIWEAQTRFKIWFEIEAHAADAQAELGVIPKEAAKTIWAKASNATFNVARIDEIERETKHDVIAFLTHLAEIVGPEARFVHQGMTSSDVLDTCLNVQLTRAA